MSVATTTWYASATALQPGTHAVVSAVATHTIKVARPVRGRYVLIWFTRLPAAGQGRPAAGTLNVVVRGSA